MHSWALVVFVITAFAAGRAAGGSLSGTIVGPDGAAVPHAPVQAKESRSGYVARVFSSATGRYSFGDLPGGRYELSIVTPCCTFMPFSKREIEVGAVEARRLDVTLEEGTTLGTFGDDPAANATFLRERADVEKGPAPRTADGKPDLSGLWLINEDPYPEEPEGLPWANALMKERLANSGKDDAPHTRCLPEGLPVPGATSPFMGKFVQTASLLVVLFEDAPGFRQIFLDGRPHPADDNPTWLGHSVGRWEGDTLVVDATGFNDRGWLELFPRTE